MASGVRWSDRVLAVIKPGQTMTVEQLFEECQKPRPTNHFRNFKISLTSLAQGSISFEYNKEAGTFHYRTNVEIAEERQRRQEAWAERKRLRGW